MKNLNRYYFHPDGMRLDMAQGDNQKGRWVKFYDHVEALRSASDNTDSQKCLCTTCVRRRIGCYLEYLPECKSYAEVLRGDKF